MPAITRTLLDTNYSNAGATTLATATVAPGADRLQLLSVFFQSTVAADGGITGITDAGGLTWVKIASDANQQGGTYYGASVWRAMGAAPSSGVRTINFSGNYAYASYVWQEFANTSTAGTNGSDAIVQSATAQINGTSSGSCALAAFGDAARNAAFTAASSYFYALTIEAPYTQDTTSASSFARGTAGFNVGQDLSVGWTCTNNIYGAQVAVELKAGDEPAFGSWRPPSRAPGRIAPGGTGFRVSFPGSSELPGVDAVPFYLRRFRAPQRLGPFGAGFVQTFVGERFRPWYVGGTAAIASSAAGRIILASAMVSGKAPTSDSARGRLGFVLVFGGKASTSNSAAAGIGIVGPDLEALARAMLVADETIVLRRVDLYEHDAVTLYAEDVDAVAWSVSVSDGTGPRRTLTATLNGDAGALLPSDTGFGFDKVVKVYRGVVLTTRGDQEHWWPVGVFDVEPITTGDFPADVVRIGGADFAARLNRASVSTVTTYAAGQSVESVVAQIAELGEVTALRVEPTGRSLSRDFVLEPGTMLWDAITKVAGDNGVECYFDAAGYLVIRIVRNADERPVEYAFTTGAAGNLARLTKEQTRGQLFNHWPVRGESADSGTEPVYASAENDEPTSPSSVGRIGRQSAPPYVSPNITTEAEAQIVAEARRALGAIRARKATVSGVVAPFLDVGAVVSVEDPNPDALEPDVAHWQLASFTIASTLGTTDYAANRAEHVGERTP